MSFRSAAGAILFTSLFLFACNDGFRGPGPVGDSSITVDGGGDSGGGDAATDSTVGDTGGGSDSTVGDSSTTDSMTGGGLGQCDPSCMAMPGAVCCQACGACNMAAVSCDPFCPADTFWDCEQLCCNGGSGCLTEM